MTRRTSRRVVTLALAAALGLTAWFGETGAADPPAVDPAVLADQAARVKTIQKVTPAVVAVCAYGGEAMGSGVLIDPDGYALTNFHVVDAEGGGTGPIMSCGLPDGQLYDAVLVGLDPVGDTALIKLLPKKEGQKFPFVDIAAGNSDNLKIGDWTFTMGNPHGFALDFKPSVAFGTVSGTNRYLKISDAAVMTYTDAIQVETAVNPGNSGGPLFNTEGHLVGINSAASIRRGGAANSGMGIAISINQIKNFLGHLRGGLRADHATLGARVSTSDSGELTKMSVTQILPDSEAYRRGLRLGDQLVEFAGRPMTSTNQYMNILGIYPKGWRVPLVYRRSNQKKEVLVRLAGVLPPDPSDIPKKKIVPPKKGEKKANPRTDSPAAKLLVEKRGFTNYYFNPVERDRLLTAAKKHGDFSKGLGSWTTEGTFDVGEARGEMRFEVVGKPDDADPKVTLNLNASYTLEPLAKQDPRETLKPLGSGGLMTALYHYRRFLTLGPKGFEGDFTYAGYEPFYPPPADGSAPKSLAGLRVDCEVIRTRHGAVECRWYFDRKDAKLLGFEAQVSPLEDPCEVYLYDYKPVGDGRTLPHRLEVRWGDRKYAVLTVRKYDLKSQ
jgi:S1-C subfamily serine protease